MNRAIVISLFLLLTHLLSAQDSKTVTVRAGTKVIDYFPFNERYRYQDFTDGKVFLKSGNIISGRFNYNILSGEMDFIRASDTLSISNPKDIRLLTLSTDTFYYFNGYLELIRSGSFRVFSKQNVIIKDIQKKGAFGTVNRTAASESYDYVLTGKNNVNLIQDQDVVLQKRAEYFFCLSGNDFFQYNRKNILKSLPGKEAVIKNYLNSNKVDFQSGDDLLRLAEFLDNLISGNH